MYYHGVYCNFAIRDLVSVPNTSVNEASHSKGRQAILNTRHSSSMIWMPPFTLLILLASIFDALPRTSADEPVRPESETPLLLVLSFDGLRADFLNEALTPNLWSLAREGVWAPRGVLPQVVTVTAPNYYTISTGLYQENHGIIGNTFYDPDLKEVYDYWKLDDIDLARKARESKWYSGEPIWQTNEKGGRFSGAMRWPLCDARVNNMTISRCFPWEDYGDLATWNNELDLLLSWFKDKKQPINLGFLYISEPDHTEHENDIYSPKVKAKLAELDALVWNLKRKLKIHNLEDRMNILFISDHGHANVYTQHNLINLDEIIDPGDYVWSSKSIFPNPIRGAKPEDLYKKLEAARLRSPRFNVWLKKDVPDRYHYKNNNRIGPIVLIEHLGYAFSSSRDGPSRLSVYSNHGFSNEYPEMRPAFFATGPGFKRNLTIDWEIENVDLYNLMAAVLQVRPAKNDGNFSRIQRLLNTTDDDTLAKHGAGGGNRAFVQVQFVLQLFLTWFLAKLLI